MTPAQNAFRASMLFLVMIVIMITIGVAQSWSVALVIINLGLISALMALGVNIQWGYAGLFNVGTMGFAALGGVAAMLVSQTPVVGAWKAGGWGLLFSGIVLLFVILVSLFIYNKLPKGQPRRWAFVGTLIAGFFAFRYFFDPATAAIEAIDPAISGYLGGFGLPILLGWAVGGGLAAGAAFIIGKISLGLRSDYLAIATLGISEIIIAIIKNEDWLTRGVKNVTGLIRPVPYEIDLQQSQWFITFVEQMNHGSLAKLGVDEHTTVITRMVIEASSLFVKLCYSGLFISVLIVVLLLSILALNSPWGRMMRAIRDNEVSASAMGKNITGRRLQVFVLGSTVVGIAGAMLTTLDGQLTPGSYQPLRFTFLIWVMVIVGGSGNNLGAVLGGFLIWTVWIEAEPVGVWLIGGLTGWMDVSSPIRVHLMETAQHMRLIVMGLVLLLVMRFHPEGILPEVVKR